MAIYSDIFIATEADMMAAPLDQHEPTEYFPTIEGKGITLLHLATLEAIATGQPDPYALADERMGTWDQCAVRGRDDGNLWVERLPDTLLDALLSLAPAEIARVAQAWEDTEEMRVSQRRAEYVAWLTEYITKMRNLAGRALAEGKCVYLWTAL